MSKRLPTLLLPLLAALVLAVATPVSAHEQDAVRFATLPKPGPGFPEGIAADHAGRIYVSTFDFSPDKVNVIHVFARNGALAHTISLPGVLPIGLQFDSKGNLYVANFGGGNILKFSPPFNERSVPDESFSVCGGAGAGCGLNAISFDAAGALYVSDSFGGRIFKIDLPAGVASLFFEQIDPLTGDNPLKPGSHGFPPFGANGLAFDKNGNLFIANTADDRIFKLTITDTAKTLTSFAESINGADGIAFDGSGRLWVAANQGDEVVALNSAGRIVERRGFFEGVGADGAANGLLFPASIVLSRGSIYVTNLALPLTGAVGDEPEEDVTTYTVSRIRLD